MNLIALHPLKYSIIGASLLCLFLSLSLENTKKDAENEGQNIAFILDVSTSMQVLDTNDISRLDTAKHIILTLIQHTLGAHASLSIFAGESIRILPLTQDFSLFETFLSGVDENNVTKQGSRIDLALEDALKSIPEDQKGTIVLLSDGSDEPTSLSSELITRLKKSDISLLVIGIGTEKGGYIPTGDVFSPYKMYQGRPVISTLNEENLRSLAQKFGGEYYTWDKSIAIGEATRYPYIPPGLFFLLACFFWILFLILNWYELYKK